MTWILNEDGAILRKFAGLTVNDANDGGAGSLRPVTVEFRMPETELSDMTFPTVIINPAGISKADDREHRGRTNLPYIPEEYAGVLPPKTVDPETGLEIDWTQDDVTLSPFYVDDFPIPYNFDYNVTVYTRFQQHMSELVTALAQQKYIPHRFGYLEVPETQTVRSLDLIGGPATVADRDGMGKRVFRTEYIVRVPSELTTYEYHQILSGDRIASVNLEVVDFKEQGWEA